MKTMLAQVSAALMPGISFLPALLDHDATPLTQKAYAWEFAGSKTVVQGQWKLLKNREPRRPSTDWMLFNLEEDPFEQTDVAGDYPQIRDRLIAAYSTYAGDFGVVDLPRE